VETAFGDVLHPDRRPSGDVLRGRLMLLLHMRSLGWKLCDGVSRLYLVDGVLDEVVVVVVVMVF
jgi:hypothetical protein